MHHGEIVPLGPEDFSAETRGLMVSVYRNAEIPQDCTNGGITHRYDQVLLVGHGISGPWTIEELVNTGKCGLLVMRKQWIIDKETRELVTRYIAVPVDHSTGPLYMFGGNFIHTSDSRFPAPYAVPVHDRRE